MIENVIQQAMQDLIPLKRKVGPVWTHFNCPVCHLNGNHRPDTKQRGQVAFRNGGFTFMCFNCGEKTGWYPGGAVGAKISKLFTNLGAENEDVQKLIVESLKIKETGDFEVEEKEEFKVKARGLPNGSKTFDYWAKNPSEQFIKAVEYLNNRNPKLLDFELYWTPDTHHNAHKRISIPVYYQNEIVGFSSRWFDGDPGSQPRYINMSPPGVLFNQKKLEGEGFVILVEGALDALSVDGVATLKSFPSDQQTKFLNQSEKIIVVLPDRDYTGNKMIDHAIENEWSVSFPDWGDDIKDAEQAMAKFGRLFTIDMILNSRVEGDFNINLRRKFWLK